VQICPKVRTRQRHYRSIQKSEPDIDVSVNRKPGNSGRSRKKSVQKSKLNFNITDLFKSHNQVQGEVVLGHFFEIRILNPAELKLHLIDGISSIKDQLILRQVKAASGLKNCLSHGMGDLNWFQGDICI
jgi:hypothetical protein